MKKSLIIKEEIHIQLKKHCDENGLKIQKLIEKLIIKYLENDRENTKL